MTDKKWDLSTEGKKNISLSLLKKLQQASQRLEIKSSKKRTFINIDAYQIDVLYYAVQDYLDKLSK